MKNEDTRCAAVFGIHVERPVLIVRQKYGILKDIAPVLLSDSPESDGAPLDKIVLFIFFVEKGSIYIIPL